ncbi:MAG: dihydroorotate dehydrogenase electron transfer subunit [Bacteroidales bacterium]|nr:dihydroorotate dehydrogenase electron transfer subunit [Bacteroidales bacterium]
MTKKYLKDYKIVANEAIHRAYSLMVLATADGSEMPPMEPGQFVEVAVPDAPHTLLRRPISVHDVTAHSISLLIRRAGEGTDRLCDMPVGSSLNILGPLGHGFDLRPGRSLLAGGGVGVAPLLYLGKRLKESGAEPTFLLGARSKDDVLRLPEFEAIGKVYVSTEDGTLGHKGLITANPAWQQQWPVIYCCGPMPMMKAVARLAAKAGTECQVSLENMMACGLGACLCCVEPTIKGNVCVCTEGPVFNINQLLWQE